MTTVKIFEPALCCSTGICGEYVDQQLLRFASDLAWLESVGVTVVRCNLADHPCEFDQDEAVKAAIATKGEFGLPLVKVNDEVKSCGVYPSRGELAAWVGLDAPSPGIFTDAVAELVAIGAAIASNCEPCFKFHFDKARKLGVTQEDMWSAVSIGRTVKDAPARAVLALAERYLRRDESGAVLRMVTGEGDAPASSGRCC